MKITARYAVIIMLSIGVSALYSLRSVTGMMRPYLITVIGHKPKNVSADVCKGLINETKLKRLTNFTEPIEWQHTIKLSYDSARAVAHFVSGMSCDITGGRYVVLSGVLGGATLMLLYPTLLKNSPPWSILMYNIVSGSFGGYVMPALMTLIGSWSPLNRKTVFVAVVYAGGPISKILEYVIINYFTVGYEEWESVFYMFAILGFVYAFFYMYIVFSKPGMHPFISREERVFLEKQLGTKVPKSIPWKSIVTDGHVIAILFGKLSHLWIQNINQSYLPQYFANVLKLDLRTKGNIYFILPHLLHFISIVTASMVVQYSINKHGMQLTQIRIFCTMFGAIAPAIFMLLMSHAECNLIVAHILSYMVICSQATMNLGVKANILDITSHFPGFCEAFTNGTATFGVMALPKLMTNIITDHSIHAWRRFYWITLACTSFLATMHYLFVGSTRAKWDHLQKKDYYIYDEEFLETEV